MHGIMTLRAAFLKTAIFFLGVAAARPLWAQTPAAEPLPGTERLGAHTVSYLYRMSWEELKEKLAGTTALRVIETPHVQAFFREVQRLGERGDAAAPLYRFALTALHQELIFATTQAADAGAVPRSFALVRPGPQAKAGLQAQFKAALEAWPGDLKKDTVEGIGFSVLDEDGDPIYAAWKDDLCYWALGAEAAQEALGPPRGETLAQAALFRATTGPLRAGQKGKPIALYYYDLRPTWKRFSVNNSGAAWERMSWRSLDAVAGATWVEGKGYRNRHYWKIGAKRAGLFEHSRTAKINQEWLKRIPAEATSFTTGVWDAFSFAGSLAAFVGGLFGAEAEVIAAPGQVVPLTPLLSNVGHRYLIYRVPGRYGTFPLVNALPMNDLVLITELSDAAQFKQMLEALLAQAGGLLSTGQTKFGEHEVFTINLVYLTVYCAFLEKELLMAFHPQLFKDALENWKRPGPALVDTPAWQAARRWVPEDACFIMYFAPKGFCRGIYDPYVPQLQQMISMTQAFAVSGFFGNPNQRLATEAGRGLNVLQLPRGSDLAQYVTEPTILAARDDGEGVLFDGYAPVLSTPYYWVYFHALGALQPFGRQGFYGIMSYLAMPVEPKP